MDIGLVTWEGGPSLAEDDAVLAAPLRARGLRAVPVVWSDPTVRWRDFALIVVRSTWDYFFRAEAFFAWLDRMEREGAKVWNPVPVLRWNAHKGYLLELEARGVPIAPTVLLRPGAILLDAVRARGWEDVVVKPAISGAGRLTQRFSAEAFADEGQRHLEAVFAEGEALVQPFLPSLGTRGERSWVYIDGALTHVVSRAPTLGAEGGALPDGVAAPEDEAERALAEKVMAALPGPLLYARVDVATGLRGEPVLQEAELIEPRLFFRQGGPSAADRMAEAIARRVAG